MQWVHQVCNVSKITVSFIISASFALALPDLGDMIALIGAVASSALALIFPPLLHLMVFGQQDRLTDHRIQQTLNTNIKQAASERFQRTVWMTKDVLIILLGIVGLGFGSYASINSLIDYFHDNFDVDNTCVNFFPR